MTDDGFYKWVDFMYDYDFDEPEEESVARCLIDSLDMEELISGMYSSLDIQEFLANTPYPLRRQQKEKKESVSCIDVDLVEFDQVLAG